MVVYVAIDAANNRRLLECQVLHSPIHTLAWFLGKLCGLREDSGIRVRRCATQHGGKLVKKSRLGALALENLNGCNE